MNKFFSLLLLGGLLFAACGDDDSLSIEEQLAVDIQKIQDYLTDNGLVAESTPSGLHYIIDEPGSGGHPSTSDEVTVTYKGYFLNGDVFDQSTNPITFPLNAVIAGWQEGIPKFQKGGKGTLLLPSNLAYGSNPPGGIPANSVMLFDVELIDF